jgi:tetratricopeptide (TPR) repeat protein
LAIAGWENLMDSHPTHLQFAAKLATTCQQCPDLPIAISGLRAVLRIHPAYIDAQDYLSAAYAKHNNKFHAISGWHELTSIHPAEEGFLRRLDEVYLALNDHDKAMEGWWMLLVSHPLHLPIFKKFNNACSRKHHFENRSIFYLLYFVWLCLLLLATEISVAWGFGELDWWPLASEDELMMLRPYMVQEEMTHVCPSTTENLIVEPNWYHPCLLAPSPPQ